METAQLNPAGFAIVAGLIRVYHVAPESGEFTYASDEYVSVGVGIPAHSYLDAPPPAKPGFAICRRGTRWEYVADLRGERSYSTVNGALHVVEQLGPLPAGFTLTEPSTPFDRWDGGQWVTDKEAQRTAQQKAAGAEQQRLLKLVAAAIPPLQDAVELSMASDEEIERYNALRRYRVLLNRVDTAAAPDIQWPEPPRGLNI